MDKRNVGILLGAALVITGFFLGWFGIDNGVFSFSITGWGIAKIAKEQGLWYLLLYLLPVGALAAGVIGLKNPQKGAKIAAAVGGTFLLWAVIEVARVLWRTTFIGLWLTVAGALVLCLAGLAGMGKKRVD